MWTGSLSSSSCERSSRSSAASLGGCSPSFKKNLGRATDHVPALVLELGVALSHLVPDAAQRVVGEELDHVAGREELVAEGQFVGIAGSVAFLAGLISQFLGREILVDPADGFVLRPNLRPFLPQFGFLGLDAAAVQQVQHFIERLLPRIEAVGRVVGVEQHADLVGEQAAQPVQEMPIGDILMAGAIR